MDKPHSTFHLLTIHDNATQRNIILDKKQYSIGRNSENTIMIRDLAISRYHCTIFPIEYKILTSPAPLIF